jgi:hypothetical protein
VEGDDAHQYGDDIGEAGYHRYDDDGLAPLQGYLLQQQGAHREDEDDPQEGTEQRPAQALFPEPGPDIV